MSFSGQSSKPNVPSICMFITGLVLISSSLFISKESFLLSSTKESTSMEFVSDAGLPFASAKNAHTTRSGAKCLTFEDTFDKLVASQSRGQTIIAMPPKGGGTAAQNFSYQCGNKKRLFFPNNFNHPDTLFKPDFVKDRAMPSVLAQHLYDDQAAIRLLNNLAPDSLFVYLHRDEHDRLISAIRTVVEDHICTNQLQQFMGQDSVSIKDGHCVVNEEHLTDLIRKKPNEIGDGARKILSCDFYDALYETSTEVVFMHYKQLDNLQKALAKYHCPELVGAKRVHSNSAGQNGSAFVKLESDGSEMALNDWLDAKRGLLSFAFDLKKGQTCGRKTKIMQQDLLGCEDEILQVTLDTSFN